MGLKKCEILFDIQYNTYYPGQTIKGVVNLTFDSTKKIRAILIKFKGEAKTKWTERRRRRNRRRRRRHLSGTEEYFKIEYYLLGSRTGDKIELSTGTHSYPFSCELPTTLPSSFEGLHGHIRYTAKVTLDRPWKFDQEYKTAFTVVSTVDLNLNSLVKTPVDKSFEKTFGCSWFGWCCATGSFKLTGSLPYTGYVSGQEIPLSINYINNSSVEIQSIKIELKKTISFHSQHPRRTKKLDETVWERIIESIDGHQSNTINQPIVIPALPPSNLDHCSIIDLDYEIKIQVKFTGAHISACIKIPIVLGTIPLTAQITMNSMINKGSSIDNTPHYARPGIGFVANSTEPSAAGPSNSNSTFDPDAPPPPYHSLYPNMPLPTYTESEFKVESIQDENDDNEHTQMGFTNFAPRYPVYNFMLPSNVKQ
ncbi:arrestin domain-containing protein 17-like [Chrysoperla carnea]|uniref:arrestin domain-containing protein 17-like n=1 Tax=Chrysoperla carnea TaxID=189513 RepID=UPI001D07C6B5|nr:arrestin domain-containing protein 17-like [Chrysoperla carnea]XP_044727912.1 arrestin domain-containing protein 17-like [Chrysoperla carnea]